MRYLGRVNTCTVLSTDARDASLLGDVCNRFDSDPKPHHFLQLTTTSDDIMQKMALHATVHEWDCVFLQSSLHLKNELKAILTAKSMKIREESI